MRGLRVLGWFLGCELGMGVESPTSLFIHLFSRLFLNNQNREG